MRVLAVFIFSFSQFIVDSEKKWKGSILFFYFLNNYYFNGNLAATPEEKQTLIRLGSRKNGFTPKSKACKFHQTWAWAAQNLPWTLLSQTVWAKEDSHGQLWPCKQKQSNGPKSISWRGRIWQSICFMKIYGGGRTREASQEQISGKKKNIFLEWLVLFSQFKV